MAIIAEYGLTDRHTAFFRSVDDSTYPVTVITEIVYHHETDELVNPERTVLAKLSLSEMVEAEETLRAFVGLVERELRPPRSKQPPTVEIKVFAQGPHLRAEAHSGGVQLLECRYNGVSELFEFPPAPTRTHGWVAWRVYMLAMSLLVGRVTGQVLWLGR